MINIERGNIYHGKLPRGCELCLLGLKSVIFITGLCNVKCFYCPVSRDRKGRDVIYINDVNANLITILEEIENSLSRGVAITGGEPSLVDERLCELCKFLKREYGEDFHIHIYTNPISWSRHFLMKICQIPIDELRLHITCREALHKVLINIKYLRDTTFDIGVEVPVFPGWEENIVNVVEDLYHRDIISFVNLNEVDINDSNVDNIINRGYEVDYRGFLRGSYESCIKVLNILSRKFRDLNIHVCTSTVKDSIQVRLRMYTRSIVYASSNQYVQEDGTVIRYVDGRVVREVLIGRSFKIFEII